MLHKSAYLPWLCHSGERPVARRPLVFFLFLHCHLFSFLSYPSLSSPLLFLLPFSGRRRKMTTRGDVSLNPNTIKQFNPNCQMYPHKYVIDATDFFDRYYCLVFFFFFFFFFFFVLFFFLFCFLFFFFFFCVCFCCCFFLTF